jgi:hypothetical protein
MNWDIVFCEFGQSRLFKKLLCLGWGGGRGHEQQPLQNQVALSQM